MHKDNEKRALSIIHKFTPAKYVHEHRIQRGRYSWIEITGSGHVLHEYFVQQCYHMVHGPATLRQCQKEEERGYYLHSK